MVGSSISFQLGSPLPRVPRTWGFRPRPAPHTPTHALGPVLRGPAARKCCYQLFFTLHELNGKVMPPFEKKYEYTYMCIYIYTYKTCKYMNVQTATSTYFKMSSRFVQIMGNVRNAFPWSKPFDIRNFVPMS